MKHQEGIRSELGGSVLNVVRLKKVCSSVVQGSKLTSLVELDLSCSSLIRDYSSAYYSLSCNLTTHSVSQSTLWAKPISNLTNQRFLDLSNCRISGEIPVEIPDFGGNLPDCIGQLHDLSYLIVSGNNMNGSIPSLSSFFQNSTPYMLDLGFCGLTVKIDQQPFPPIFQPQILSLDSCNIGDITYIKKQSASRIEKVRALDLSANNFTGSIPAEVGQGNIRYLALSDNEPSGRIPFSLCQEKREGRCKRKGGSGMELNDAVLINESCGTPHVIAGHVGIEMDQGNNDKKGPGNQSKNIADDSKLLP
ncbi:hypothetical protein V6N13_054230 [Hibiscus sabdariffa]